MKRITVPIYERPLIFVDAWDEMVRLSEKHRTTKQAKEWEPIDEGVDLELPMYGMTCAAGNKILMGVFDGESRTAVHEADHAASMVLDYAGVIFGPDNDEPHAYLQDWIYGQWVKTYG